MYDFSKKCVLVTGGSSGIGNAAALLFRDCGANVHVTGTRASPDDYADTADSNLDGLIYHQFDGSSEANVHDFTIVSPPLDILVNSIGTTAYEQREYDIETFSTVLRTNLTSIMALCVKYKEQLASTSGSIVNVGSIASFKATMGNPAYSASKGGLLTLTRSLAQAWARDGIRVNNVAPGYVATKLTAQTYENEVRKTRTEKSIPLGRWGEPKEIAHAIAFLASPYASYITGEVLVVDGGVTL